MDKRGLTKQALDVFSRTLPVFLLGLASILVLNFTTDVFKSNGDDTPGVTLPSDFPDFEEPDTSEDGTKSTTLYSSFIMTQPITTSNIIGVSRLVSVSGEIETATLHFVANTTSENKGNTNRRHTVYFYIDNGISGGHIGTDYHDENPTHGFFTEDDGEYEREYPLSALPVSQFPDGPKFNIKVLERLQDGQEHYVGAFVSTGSKGILERMWIEYTCVEGSECSINVN